jgi:hypothetical protein
VKLRLRVVCVVAKKDPETDNHVCHTYYAIDEMQAKKFFSEDHQRPISHVISMGIQEVEVDYEHYEQYYQPYYEYCRQVRDAVYQVPSSV